MIIGLDIDGTVCTHDYPRLGKDIGAFPWLRKAQEAGAKFVVFTMRDGPELKRAIELLSEHGIEIYGANVNPTQWRWTMSPKAYCHLYVDDGGLGMPLTKRPLAEDCGPEPRFYVDWELAGPLLLEAVERFKVTHVGIRDQARYAGRESDG